MNRFNHCLHCKVCGIFAYLRLSRIRRRHDEAMLVAFWDLMVDQKRAEDRAEP